MAIIEKIYEKNLLSKTIKIEIENYPKNKYNKIQDVSDIEIKIKEDISLKFCYEEKYNLNKKIQEGCCKNQIYKFYFENNLEKIKDEEKSQRYSLFLKIKKAGDYEEIKKLSDLEEFILKEGFEEI
jgi:hypothetical protein